MLTKSYKFPKVTRQRSLSDLEVLPCLYCENNKLQLIYFFSTDACSVHCLNCGITGPRCSNDDLAMSAWNDLSEKNLIDNNLKKISVYGTVKLVIRAGGKGFSLMFFSKDVDNQIYNQIFLKNKNLFPLVKESVNIIENF